MVRQRILLVGKNIHSSVCIRISDGQPVLAILRRDERGGDTARSSKANAKYSVKPGSQVTLLVGSSAESDA